MSRLEMVKLTREWRSWSNRIAEAARRVLGECEVYVFGSVAEGRGSDVDILIVSANTPENNVEAEGDDRGGSRAPIIPSL